MKQVVLAIIFFQFWGMSAQTDTMGKPAKAAKSVESKHISTASDEPSSEDGVLNSKDTSTEEYSAVMVEVKARFPGGESEFYRYIAQKMQYPTRCMENEIRGQVMVRFMVDKTGSVSRVSVLKDVNACPEFSKEAIRVISTSPRWIPAQSNGRFVNSWMQIPIRFEM